MVRTLLQMLQEAQQVDVAFLMDCTGSMEAYIAAAKDKIHAIAKSLQAKFPHLKMRVAFVGYRDHCDGTNRFVKLDFTDDHSKFSNFLKDVKAFGGGDAAEDVFGGAEHT